MLVPVAIFLAVSPAEASCPPGDSNPITSGTGVVAEPVVFSFHPGPVRGSFFLLGAGDQHNSGTLPVTAWLRDLGDLDGDGRIEYRLDAPGEGPGGWGDPRASGCPSAAPTSHPPLVVILSQVREDLDADVVPDEDRNGNGILDPGEDLDGSGTLNAGAPWPRWDMFEDSNRNGILDAGEDTHPFRGDLDGRLTVSGTGPYTGGCEGIAREDVDCDGRIDWINEDLNGNGRFDPGEDLDGDRRWDNVYEDLNGNGILDGEIDTNQNGLLDPAEDLNGNGRWDGEDTNRNGKLDGAYGFVEDRIPNLPTCDPGQGVVAGCYTPVLNPGEDRNGNGILDPGEDLGNGILDPGEDRNFNGNLDYNYIEDRNGDALLNDFVFPNPDRVVYRVNPDGTRVPLPPYYPHASFRPAPGGMVIASVAWNGVAYDFDALDAPGREIILDDGRRLRAIDATVLDRFGGVRISGVRRVSVPFAVRMRVDPFLPQRVDDVGGERQVFNGFELSLIPPPVPSPAPATFIETGGPSILIPVEGGFVSFRGSGSLVSRAQSPGSNAFLAGTGLLVILVPEPFDQDGDARSLPNDNCPEAGNPFQSDLGLDGLGDDCDPARNPDAAVDGGWAERLAEPGPGLRPGAAAAYDADRGVTVLFGGSADVATWEYDGAAWSRIETKTSPAARRGHRMAYDDTRGRTLLFGGTTLAGEPLNDLWQFDGRAWKRIVTSISPTPRHGTIPGADLGAASFGLAYDSARRLLVLFGGDGTDRTWVFDGARWRIVPTPRSPLPRFEPQMAYDPLRQVSVLHGGFDPSESGGNGVRLFNDTWEFDGETWQEVDAGGDLPPSWGGEMAFDPGRRQIAVFGGEFERLLISPPPGLRVFSPWAATRLFDGLSWSFLPSRPTIAPQTDHAAAFDVARNVLVVHGGVLVDGEARGNTAELRRTQDGDADGVNDVEDNCPRAANPDQADRDRDGSGDACDNCPGDSNPAQRDLDRDGAGDACDDDIDGDGRENRSDACPAAYVPGRPLSSVLEGGGPDGDGDGTADDCDPCPRDARNDADQDGICADVDNCPGTFNPLQEDSTPDGSGDACQPVLVLSGIQEDGGEVLEVTAVARDPNHDPLSGSIDFFATTTFVLRSADVDNLACDIDAYPPGLRPGEGIGYAAFSAVEASLFDIASAIGCNEGGPDFLIARGPCDRPLAPFNLFLGLSSAPVPICIARFQGAGQPAGDPMDLTVLGFDQTVVRLSRTDTSPALRIPFSAGLPRRSLLSNLVPGTVYRLLITVTDGSSAPVTAEDTFLYQGEAVMAIGTRFGRPGATPGEPLP